MREIVQPGREMWASLCRRPALPRDDLLRKVQGIYNAVVEKGDAALYEMTEKLDGLKLSSLSFPVMSENAESNSIGSVLKKAVDIAYANITQFHAAQSLPSERIETMAGVTCWREARPIESVGLYIPGGTAPLISTMLMLGVPAGLAGCKNIVVCTPPAKDGTVNPAIRYAAAKCGIHTVFTIGGAQAVAAMALGTQTIPKVSKIFGPGNQYVTAAKAEAAKYGVAIDMPAGPSEVLVIADGSARADFVAADLLSQAEHGTDSQVVLLTTSRKLQASVKAELRRQLRSLPRCSIAEAALRESLSIYFDGVETACMFANEYAAEHVILQIADAEAKSQLITNAGSVFIGRFTPESAGDYASGTNHTLPTNGWAKSYGGVSLASFQRMVTFQSITPQGLMALSDAIVPLAEAEGLRAHAQAVSIRLNNL